MPVIISAHGALGYWDEVIFVGVAVVFLLMMVASWLKSRDMAADHDPQTPAGPGAPPAEKPDHFRLD